MALELLRHIPFVAKVDIKLEVGGKSVASGIDLYDGINEWVVYTSYKLLPCQVKEVITNNLPNGVKSIQEYLSNPSTEQDNEANRVAVTPTIIYKTSGENKARITSSGRFYLVRRGDKYRWISHIE